MAITTARVLELFAQASTGRLEEGGQLASSQVAEIIHAVKRALEADGADPTEVLGALTAFVAHFARQTEARAVPGRRELVVALCDGIGLDFTERQVPDGTVRYAFRPRREH